ncbi:leucine-rich protein [Mycena floridula]|nr:leucine-rich protein [Mycena floridula]
MALHEEPGDDYIRRISTMVRANERNLAQAGLPQRRRQQSAPASNFNPLGWFAPGQPGPPKALILALDTHHLFYLLMRMEAMTLPVGTLDVRVDSPSRPMSYINIFPDSDKSETLSLASFRSSFSVVSRLSLGGGWWGRPEPPNLDAELKYLYSSFTKLPALQITAPGPKVIAELANEPPNENAIPLDSFKTLESLECVDIDPRTLLGWDQLAVSLKSLKIKKSGLEDVSDIFIGAVLDDAARKAGSSSRKRRRKLPHGPNRQISFYGTQLPDSVPEDLEENEVPSDPPPEPPETPPVQLSKLHWASLKHLFLSDNSLTFLPAELFPLLVSLTHLDLSSNLFVSVPAGLGALYNLMSLNISDNMIDSVLGIYQNLGQVLTLNLSRNRLESICGLERLHALERVDLRENQIEESAEIGRLATLPNIKEVWIEGNPFVEYEEGYRVACFDYFWKEEKTITLDGTPPGFYEKRNLTSPPPQQMSSSRPVSAAINSPPTVAIGHAHAHAHPQSPPQTTSDHAPSVTASANVSPHLAPVSAVGVSGKPRRKKTKRIVDLDGDLSDGSTKSTRHIRTRSDGVSKDKGKVFKSKQTAFAPPDPIEGSTINSTPRRSRHSRYQTEHIPDSQSTSFARESESPTDLPPLPEFRRSRGSQTFSSRSAARRARVTASVYEPPTADVDHDEEEGEQIKDDAEAFRRKIEALKADMGDGWLKVFSQSQLKT